MSGRRATDARRIVSIGSIAYVGNHGGELLPPSGTRRRVDPELRGLDAAGPGLRRARPTRAELRRLRVRARGQGVDHRLPLARRARRDEARVAVRAIAADGRGRGLAHALGPQGARGPPAGADRQGRRDRAACCATPTWRTRSTSATTRTDLDAFRALGRAVARGRPADRRPRRRALRREARRARARGRPARRRADGVHQLLRVAARLSRLARALRRLPQGDGPAQRGCGDARWPRSRSSRVGDGSEPTLVFVSAGWWLRRGRATAIWLGRGSRDLPADRAAAGRRAHVAPRCPRCSPGARCSTGCGRCWWCTIAAPASLAVVSRRSRRSARGFAIIWALALARARRRR